MKLEDYNIMQVQIDQLKGQVLNSQAMDNALTHLFDIGLIKKMGDGKFAAV